jgi:polynucleotide 5'-hydroxyl-kinase GRC3/NOL9
MDNQAEAAGVYIVKGPAIVLANGPCSVLGKDVSDRKTIVSAGKALPFEYCAGGSIKVNLGRGGMVWEADPASAGVYIWQDVARKMLEIRPNRIMLAGDSDAGKSTLSTYLANVAIQHQLRPAVIDGDIGQGDLAPPAAIGAAVISRQLVDLKQARPDIFEFVGDTTPVGFEHIVTAKLNRIARILHGRSDMCVVNTDGYVKDGGTLYKRDIARELQADMVICMGPSAPVLSDAIKAGSPCSYVMQANSAGQAIKSRAERVKFRLSRFLRYAGGRRAGIKMGNLASLAFVYKNQIFSGQVLAETGYLPVEEDAEVRLADMSRMFVGLGARGRVEGFGIVTGISTRRISIQTSVQGFDRIYLSRIGLAESLNEEFRIF